MPLTDQTRIAQDMAAPRIVTLWQALNRLRSVVSFMNTGAHPDDETSDLLAALAFRDGFTLSYACSTRGEGGQNDIGTEGGGALGTLRTAEMEVAAARLDMTLYWLGDSVDDPMSDFGFSKSGVETLGKWGHAHTIARFVDIIRREQPDILCPTFLDVPGQHGHHRAMTQALGEAFEAAADPGFAGSDLPVWSASKMYLPAWSGAGQSYDDDEAPPPMTLTVSASGSDPVTGWPYARIGQQSRAAHLTQGMGRWVASGRDIPLHLARSRIDSSDTELSSGLARDLRDLGFGAAQDSIDIAIAAFPDCDEVLRHAAAALGAVQAAKSTPLIAKKLARKEIQLSRVMEIAAGVSARARLAQDFVRPGEQVAYSGEVTGGVAFSYVFPKGWDVLADQVTVPKDAEPSDPYPTVFDPSAPRLPVIEVTIEAHGVTAKTQHGFEVAPVVLPQNQVVFAPSKTVINLFQTAREFDFQGMDGVSLELPKNWRQDSSVTEQKVILPVSPLPDLYQIPVLKNGAPGFTVQAIQYPHIAPRALCRPAVLAVRVLDVALPDAETVNVIGGGASSSS